MYSQGNK